MEHGWDYFITDTFKRERRDPISSAFALWKPLHEVFGATRSFVAVEPHETGALHLHALARFGLADHAEDAVYENSLPRASAIWKYLFKAHGRNKVELAHDALAVSRYCAKYVVKDGFHYEFFGDKAAWVLDK